MVNPDFFFGLLVSDEVGDVVEAILTGSGFEPLLAVLAALAAWAAWAAWADWAIWAAWAANLK